MQLKEEYYRHDKDVSIEFHEMDRNIDIGIDLGIVTAEKLLSN